MSGYDLRAKPIKSRDTVTPLIKQWWNERIVEGWPFQHGGFDEGNDYSLIGFRKWPYLVNRDSLLLDFRIATGSDGRGFHKKFRKVTGHTNNVTKTVRVHIGVGLYQAVPAIFIRFKETPVSLIPL